MTMEKNVSETYDETNPYNPLSVMQSLQGILSPEEEYTFMQLLFSSSATIRKGNFGLQRQEVEKLIGCKGDENGLASFCKRVNQAVGRYFRVIYDERRDHVVVIMRVPARQARTVLSKEALAILMFIFYHQQVLQHEFTLYTQLLQAFGHESMGANQKIRVNVDALRKIGAIDDYKGNEHTNEDAYELTTIGAHLFSDSFLRRYTEFSQSNQLHMEDVLKFFKRYNMEGDI